MGFFDKIRAGKTVLKRTRKAPDLPEYVLYMGWLGGEMKRKVLDPEGVEMQLGDKVIESNYRTITEAQAKGVVEKYWANVKVGA